MKNKFEKLESEYNFALNTIQHYIFILNQTEDPELFGTFLRMVDMTKDCKKEFDIALPDDKVKYIIRDVKKYLKPKFKLNFYDFCLERYYEVKTLFLELKKKFDNYDFEQHKDSTKLHDIFRKETLHYSSYERVEYPNDIWFIKIILRDLEQSFDVIKDEIETLNENKTPDKPKTEKSNKYTDNQNNQSEYSSINTNIIEHFNAIDDVRSYKYAFRNENDMHKFADLLTEYFIRDNFEMPKEEIKLQRSCKTRLAKVLKEIHYDAKSKKTLRTDLKFYEIIKILDEFADLTNEQIYRFLIK
jgi:hypothetical protein